MERRKGLRCHSWKNTGKPTATRQIFRLKCIHLSALTKSSRFKYVLNMCLSLPYKPLYGDVNQVKEGHHIV